MEQVTELLKNLITAIETHYYNEKEGVKSVTVTEDSPEHLKQWQKAFWEAKDYVESLKSE